MVALKEGTKMAKGENAFIHAKTQEKIYTRAGPEFGDKCGCTIIIKTAL